MTLGILCALVLFLLCRVNISEGVCLQALSFVCFLDRKVQQSVVKQISIFADATELTHLGPFVIYFISVVKIGLYLNGPHVVTAQISGACSPRLS